jgi:hypothetical protein
MSIRRRHDVQVNADGGVWLNVYAPLARLLLHLPRSQRWTRRDRDRWLSAFAALLDMVIDVFDVCPRCGNENQDNWPLEIDGEIKDGGCQGCWEAECSRTWWEAQPIFAVMNAMIEVMEE